MAEPPEVRVRYPMARTRGRWEHNQRRQAHRRLYRTVRSSRSSRGVPAWV